MVITGCTSVGCDDDEADDDKLDVVEHEFGWDNEHPRREVEVGEFRIEWRPVTNGEFFAFFVGAGKNKVQFPSSWVEIGGEIQVWNCGFARSLRYSSGI